MFLNIIIIMFVYLLKLKNKDLYKIGVSKSPNQRIGNLQTGSPYEIEIVSIFNSIFSFKIEKFLHNIYQYKQYNNDDFNYLEGEWFELDINDILSFPVKCKEIEDNLNFLISEKNPYI